MPAPTLGAVPGLRHGRGGPRRRPTELHADEAWDHRRWLVERTLARLKRFRRLTVRHERRADVHLALVTLGCALICLSRLERLR